MHPFPPISAASVRDWQAVLRDLPGPSDDRRSHVLLGDFNATLDHRELRRVLDRGYTDAADATGDGLSPTFPVTWPIPLIAIDHVLVPRTIGVRRVSIGDLPGSDHRAVVAELVLPERAERRARAGRRRGWLRAWAAAAGSCRPGWAHSCATSARPDTKTAMLREIQTARSCAAARRWRFHAGRRVARAGVAGAPDPRARCAPSSIEPVALVRDGPRCTWVFEDRFYWEDDGLGTPTCWR